MKELISSPITVNQVHTLPYTRKQYYNSEVIRLPHKVTSHFFIPQQSYEFTPLEWLKMRNLAIRKNKLAEFLTWQRGKFLRFKYD